MLYPWAFSAAALISAHVAMGRTRVSVMRPALYMVMRLGRLFSRSGLSTTAQSVGFSNDPHGPATSFGVPRLSRLIDAGEILRPLRSMHRGGFPINITPYLRASLLPALCEERE